MEIKKTACESRLAERIVSTYTLKILHPLFNKFSFLLNE